jgi:N-acetyl-alpha-D-glucosaminyl L-malate synthase BshA
VHYAIPHAYAGYMAKQMLKDEGIEIPMVTTLHGTDITWLESSLYKPAVSFSINKSDIVTSVSESLKEDTYKLFNIKKDIYVIPNFIELDKNIQDPDITCRRSVMAKENERIITHISNFREVKRIPDVIQIFYKIQQKVPAKLMMVGVLKRKEEFVSRIRYFRQSNLLETVMKSIKF